MRISAGPFTSCLKKKALASFALFLLMSFFLLLRIEVFVILKLTLESVVWSDQKDSLAMAPLIVFCWISFTVPEMLTLTCENETVANMRKKNHTFYFHLKPPPLFFLVSAAEFKPSPIIR